MEEKAVTCPNCGSQKTTKMESVTLAMEKINVFYVVIGYRFSS